MRIWTIHIGLKSSLLCLFLASGIAMAKMSYVDGMTAYQVLGAEKTETRSQIRSKFTKLLQVYHPDKGGDPSTTMLLNDAWEILKDDNKRKEYDQGLLEFRGHTIDGKTRGPVLENSYSEFDRWHLFFISAYANREVFMSNRDYDADVVRVLFELVKHYERDLINLRYSPEGKGAFREFVRETLNLRDHNKYFASALESLDAVQALRILWFNPEGASKQSMEYSKSILLAIKQAGLSDTQMFQFVDFLEELKNLDFLTPKMNEIIAFVLLRKMEAVRAKPDEQNTYGRLRSLLFRIQGVRAAIPCAKLLIGRSLGLDK